MKCLLVYSLLFLIISCQPRDQIQKPKKVSLIRLGMVSEEYYALAEEVISSHYQLQVNYADNCLATKDFYLPEYSSYAAIKILAQLDRKQEEKGEISLTITHLPIRKVLKDQQYPVMGLAYTPGCAALVSTYWMNLDFPDIEQLHQRFQKVVLHELGHNFGLEHCSNRGCYMGAVERSIQDIDSMKMQLCDACQKQLHHFFSSY